MLRDLLLGCAERHIKHWPVGKKDLLTSFHIFIKPKIYIPMSVSPHSGFAKVMGSKWSAFGGARRGGRGTRRRPRTWDKSPAQVYTLHVKVSEPNSMLLKKHDRNCPVTVQKGAMVKNPSAGAQMSASQRSPVLASWCQEHHEGTAGRHSNQHTFPELELAAHKPKLAQFMAQKDLQVILAGAHSRVYFKIRILV